MAISFVAIANNNGSDGSAEASQPSDSAGDQRLAFIASSGTSAFSSTGSSDDWTIVTGFAGGNAQRIELWRDISPPDDNPPVWTVPITNWKTAVTSYSGVDTSNPIAASDFNTDAFDDDVSLSITVGPGTFKLVAIYMMLAVTTVNTAPSGMTERVVYSTGGSFTLAVYDEDIAPGSSQVFTRAIKWNATQFSSGILIALNEGGGTVYNEAGQGTLIAVGSGADALDILEAGQGTLAAAASGADSITADEAGQGTLSAIASGADAATVAESGTGALGAVGAGTDALIASEAGQGTLTAAGAGTDTLTASETGQGTLGAVGAGADSLGASETGQGTLGATAGGLDTITAAEAGQGTLGAIGAGADTFSGGSVYNETGGAVTALVASGTDALVTTETGGAVAVASGAAADMLVMVETGGGLLVAVGGGADSMPALVVPGIATVVTRVPAATVAARTPSATVEAQGIPTALITPRNPSASTIARVPSATVTAA